MSTNNTFAGHSKNGDFNEALHDAFRAALDELPTDYIVWELKDVRGEYGGFTTADNLTVTIVANLPKGA